MNITYIILAVVALPLAYLVYVYNSLVKWRNRVKEAWSDTEVQLKRRLDLIPNLIETVKGYAGHESSVLKEVTEARTNLMNAQKPAEYAQADNMLEGALKSLFAVSESYPDLKANENFLELQRELSDTENKIQSARRFYNGVVRDYNTFLQTFPNNIISQLFVFEPEEFFELSENEKEDAEKPVKVKF